MLSYYAPTTETAREHYRAHTEHADEERRSAHPLIDGDDAFIARMLAGLELRPGIPNRYLRSLAPALEDLLASADVAAIASAHEHGYSLRQIARHLGVNASTVSGRLHRHAVRVQAATEET